MKVVFDTNILVSAMLWRGTPYRCLLAIRAGLAELILSPPIMEELRGVLNKKFAMTKEDAEENIAVTGVRHADRNSRHTASCDG